MESWRYQDPKKFYEVHANNSAVIGFPAAIYVLADLPMILTFDPNPKLGRRSAALFAITVSPGEMS